MYVYYKNFILQYKSLMFHMKTFFVIVAAVLIIFLLQNYSYVYFVFQEKKNIIKKYLPIFE